MKTKKCTKCGEIKKLSDFHKSSRSKDKRVSKCKACRKIERRAAYLKNREIEIACSRKFRQENPDYRSNYYQANKTRELEYKKNYTKERYETDSAFRVKENIRSRAGQAFREYSKLGKCKRNSEYGIDYQAIYEHIGECPGDRDDYHIDHILPLCNFNHDNESHIRVAWSKYNHRWLLKTENLSRSNEIDAEAVGAFIRSNFF